MATAGRADTFGWDGGAARDGVAAARQAGRMHRRTAFATAAAALVVAVVLGAAPVALAAEAHPSDHQSNRGWDSGNRGWSTQDGGAGGGDSDD